MKPFVPTARSKLKRLPKRGRYDRETVYAILDAAFVCHLGYVIGRQPYVTPTAYWREGGAVYWHGSCKSRMPRAQEKSPQVCLTVTILDGLVGLPIDEEQDYALPIWAGVVNVGITAGQVEDDPGLAAGTRRPDRLNSLEHPGIQ